MEERKCACGRVLYKKFNSTIVPKQCPSCQLKGAVPGIKKTKEKGKRKAPTPWRYKTTKDMITHAQSYIVNPYIRERDNTVFMGKSISDNGSISDAGHYYSVGAKVGLRFCVQNIHGQSASGNRFKGSDALNYRKGLIQRFDEEYVKELERLAQLSEGARSLDRFNVMAIAETYIYLHKNKIWVFKHKEFEVYKTKIIGSMNQKKH